MLRRCRLGLQPMLRMDYARASQRGVSVKQRLAS
jgi:hypothetical protein